VAVACPDKQGARGQEEPPRTLAAGVRFHPRIYRDAARVRIFHFGFAREARSLDIDPQELLTAQVIVI
jgi:hypothetical protein